MWTTRRELLHGLLGAQVARLSGCSLPQIRSFDGRFVEPNHTRGHGLKNPHPRSLGAEPTEGALSRKAKVLILGAGVSGLVSAWKLRRLGVQGVVLIDLESRPGGTALGESQPLGGYPWGAHYLPAPDVAQPELVSLLDAMGHVASYLPSGTPVYEEGVRCAEPQERVFAGGMWQSGLVPQFGVPAASRSAVDAFLHRMRMFAGVRGRDGLRAFQLPISQTSEDTEFLDLDSLSFEAWLERENLKDPLVRWLANYATRDDFGADLSTTSAWYGVHYYASRIGGPHQKAAPFLTWPDGNYHLVRYLAKDLKPLEESVLNIQTGQWFGKQRLVVGVRPKADDSGVEVDVQTKRGLERWTANKVIYALPSFLKHRLLPSERSWFGIDTSAWMTANIHLHRRPGYEGVETAWDNVLFNSASLGYIVSTHQLGPPSGPTTWTWYLPIVGRSPKEARRELMALDWRQATDLVMSDLEVAHPNIRSCVKTIDICRWGHAMPIPSPGMRTSRALKRAIEPYRGVHFAHTDLSGVGLFEEAFAHGIRAADEVTRELNRQLLPPSIHL